ncbi:MAG: hypothetical protein ILP19_01420 [Oscillospiraceae bacterium]|nr:hypothetical protein [Oscillospiraceae bacterium]
MKALFMGILAMVLIYAVIVALPRIAKAVDEAFKGVKTKQPDDGLYDIYSLHTDKDDTSDDDNKIDDDKKE